MSLFLRNFVNRVCDYENIIKQKNKEINLKDAEIRKLERLNNKYKDSYRGDGYVCCMHEECSNYDEECSNYDKSTNGCSLAYRKSKGIIDDTFDSNLVYCRCCDYCGVGFCIDHIGSFDGEWLCRECYESKENSESE